MVYQYIAVDQVFIYTDDSLIMYLLQYESCNEGERRILPHSLNLLGDTTKGLPSSKQTALDKMRSHTEAEVLMSSYCLWTCYLLRNNLVLLLINKLEKRKEMGFT